MGHVYQDVKLATVKEAEVGAVTVQIGDRSGGTIVASVRCESPLLGVETLEALGLGVDLSSGTLAPTRSWTARA